MPLWLVLKRVGSNERMRIDLEREPAPAVMADGLGGVCRRGWQYWVEGADAAGMQMPPDVVPRDGEPVP